MKITGRLPFQLMYGREPTLARDVYGGLQRSLNVSNQETLVERLLEITDKVLQLRTSARKSIKLIQEKLEEKFREKKETKFQKGDLVLYFDKPKAARHDAKLEHKWKGPYQVAEVLDKGAYRLMIDGKIIGSTVNGNLLKKFHSRSSWESQIII